MFDVVEVEAEHTQGIGPLLPPPARHRSIPAAPSGGGNTHPAPTVPGAPVAHLEGSGADQTHLAAEHVEQLRQLVDTRTAEPTPQRRDPRITPHLEQHAPSRLVEWFQVAEPMLGVGGHGTKLEEPERSSPLSLAKLPEEDRSRRGQAHQNRDQQQDRPEQHQPQQGPENIDPTLGGRPYGRRTRLGLPPPSCTKSDGTDTNFPGDRFKLRDEGNNGNEVLIIGASPKDAHARPRTCNPISNEKMQIPF